MALIGTLYIREAKALVSLHICAGSPESLLLHNVTCTKSHIFITMLSYQVHMRDRQPVEL